MAHRSKKKVRRKVSRQPTEAEKDQASAFRGAFGSATAEDKKRNKRTKKKKR